MGEFVKAIEYEPDKENTRNYLESVERKVESIKNAINSRDSYSFKKGQEAFCIEVATGVRRRDGRSYCSIKIVNGGEALRMDYEDTEFKYLHYNARIYHKGDWTSLEAAKIKPCLEEAMLALEGANIEGDLILKPVKRQYSRKKPEQETEKAALDSGTTEPEDDVPVKNRRIYRRDLTIEMLNAAAIEFREKDDTLARREKSTEVKQAGEKPEIKTEAPPEERNVATSSAEGKERNEVPSFAESKERNEVTSFTEGKERNAATSFAEGKEKQETHKHIYKRHTYKEAR